MDLNTAMIDQLSRLKLVFFFIFSIPLLIVILILIISDTLHLPIQNLLVDSATVANQNRFIGMGSNVIILFWTGTAAVVFFNALVRFHRNGVDLYFRFLVYFGLFTLMLLLDDLFLLHEGLSNFISISENLIFLSYFLILATGLLIYRRLILRTDYLLLLFSLTCFALAIIAGILQNQFQEYIGLYRVLLEATFKLLGVVSWFGYFTRVTFLKLQRQQRHTGFTRR